MNKAKLAQVEPFLPSPLPLLSSPHSVLSLFSLLVLPSVSRGLSCSKRLCRLDCGVMAEVVVIRDTYHEYVSHTGHT
jgi:hypothetical protein